MRISLRLCTSLEISCAKLSQAICNSCSFSFLIVFRLFLSLSLKLFCWRIALFRLVVIDRTLQSQKMFIADFMALIPKCCVSRPRFYRSRRNQTFWLMFRFLKDALVDLALLLYGLLVYKGYTFGLVLSPLEQTFILYCVFVAWIYTKLVFVLASIFAFSTMHFRWDNCLWFVLY